MDNDVSHELGRVAHCQGGVVSRLQALDSGMPYSTIRSKVDSGRWLRVHRGVYATFTGPLNRRAQLWAAVLYAGTGALLSHETAAEVDCLVDQPSAAIHVTVPSDRRVHPARGLVVHRASHLRDLRFPAGELPRTWIEDTILDLAETKIHLDDVCGLVTAAFGRHLTTVPPMRAVLAERKRQRWRREIGELINAAADGTHSVLEFRYDRDVERAHGLPPSRHQVPFRKRRGPGDSVTACTSRMASLSSWTGNRHTRETSSGKTGNGITPRRRMASSRSGTAGVMSGGTRATRQCRLLRCCEAMAGKGS